MNHDEQPITSTHAGGGGTTEAVATLYEHTDHVRDVLRCCVDNPAFDPGAPRQFWQITVKLQADATALPFCDEREGLLRYIEDTLDIARDLIDDVPRWIACPAPTAPTA